MLAPFTNPCEDAAFCGRVLALDGDVTRERSEKNRAAMHEETTVRIIVYNTTASTSTVQARPADGRRESCSLKTKHWKTKQVEPATSIARSRLPYAQNGELKVV